VTVPVPGSCVQSGVFTYANDCSCRTVFSTSLRTSASWRACTATSTSWWGRSACAKTSSTCSTTASTLWVSYRRPDPPACFWVSVVFTSRIVDMCIRIVRAAWRNYRVAPKKTSRWTLLVRMLPDVLQCSVVTCLWCVVIFTSTDLLLSHVMKDCCKLISVWQRYGQQYSCRFLICSG